MLISIALDNFLYINPSMSAFKLLYFTCFKTKYFLLLHNNGLDHLYFHINLVSTGDIK